MGVKQKTFINDNPNESVSENFKMCYKLVTDTKITSNDKFSVKQIKSLLAVFKSFKTSKPIDFDKLNMDENTRLFIDKLFEVDDDNFIKMLLNDFSKEMNTKMREKDNYVTLIWKEDSIILAHSKMGEKSINTDFTVFERLLDKDNVMRIVFFEKVEDKIKVRHYEKNKSKFFIKWLGIPQKNLFYSFGGENKFYSEIQGFPIVLEISDKDVDLINSNEHIDIDGENIKFKEKISTLKIKHIMRHRTKYNDYNHFKREFISRKYDLMYYKEEYKKLNESLDPTISKIFDCETEVSGGQYTLQKENQNLCMLFCNNQIELDDSFLNKIVSLFLNDEPSKITHIGDEFSETPIEIGNVKIYNEYNLNLSEKLLNYMNNVELPDNFKNELIYVILSCLKFDNPKKNICYFIDKFLSKYVHELKFDAILKEDSILELKSKEYFIGTDKIIVENLVKDIPKKLNETDYKLYLIGYDEKSKLYDSIPRYNLDDSRLFNITKNIKEQLDDFDINLMQIPFDKNNCIIMISVKQKKNNI